MTRELVEIASEALSLEKYVAFVSDPSAGAVATFSGVTRDNFDGRPVTKLEYEAYPDMALSLLRRLCGEMCEKWEITKVAVAHRVGTVWVGEPSVVIAVSSPHRKEALEACAWAIDELKAKVPIWKKEFFEDGSIWKENREMKERFA